MNKIKFVILSFIFLLLFSSGKNVYSIETIDNPAQKWKVGDSWMLNARCAGGWEKARFEKDLKVVHEYPIKIIVAGTQKYNRKLCWQVDFFPEGEKTRSFLNERYRLLINKSTGYVEKVIPYEKAIGFLGYLVKDEGVNYILEPPKEVPLFWLTNFTNKRVYKPNLGINFKKEVLKNNRFKTIFTLEIAHPFDSKDRSESQRIEQIWVPGEKWWRSYKYYDEGCLALVVRLETE